MEDLKQQYLDEMKSLINSEYCDEIKIDELKGNFNRMSIKINKKEKLQQLEQSSVENLVPIPSESEDFSDIESECDMPDCDDSQMTKFLTISNPLFNDYTSSDDESSHEEDSDPFMEEIDLFLASDGSMPSGIDSDYSDSKGDNLFLERLLHDDPIPLLDILSFSNVVRVFLPFFTYPMTSLILLSSGSEDIIFDPDISDYHFLFFIPGVSHQSGTFMKFIVYPNHLNESPMKILSSTYSLMDQ
nr:hypothetical protein [Tanacetum cinerariifolium]